jgi:hypothetical protein
VLNIVAQYSHLTANETGKYRHHNGSKTRTSRLESDFERTEREIAQKICKECSVCPKEHMWGHRRNQKICPKHPLHQEWLDEQEAKLDAEEEDDVQELYIAEQAQQAPQAQQAQMSATSSALVPEQRSPKPRQRVLRNQKQPATPISVQNRCQILS